MAGALPQRNSSPSVSSRFRIPFFKTFDGKGDCPARGNGVHSGPVQEVVDFQNGEAVFVEYSGVHPPPTPGACPDTGGIKGGGDYPPSAYGYLDTFFKKLKCYRDLNFGFKVIPLF